MNTPSWLGLGKTLFNSSACLLTRNGQSFFPDIQLILSERITRKKASGIWPAQAIDLLGVNSSTEDIEIAENRDVLAPIAWENALDRSFPFFDHLKTRKLERFTSALAPVTFVTHHLCHASAAALISPFKKCVILVIDGAGSSLNDFSSATYPSQEELRHAPKISKDMSKKTAPFLEETSVYLFDEGRLSCVRKNWQQFESNRLFPNHSISNGLGTLYENAAEFIFNCKRSSGKVMGLAGQGTSAPVSNREEFLKGLDWAQAFSGGGKSAWEHHPSLPLFVSLAATVQAHFEQSLLKLSENIRRDFPEYENLIITGGCALNCTTNMKLLETGLFDEIYIPPFPGDESIGFGAAAQLFLQAHGSEFEPLPHDRQHGYFGCPSSVPEEKKVLSVFASEKVTRPDNIARFTAKRLEKGEIIAWYQGRSESGPRALGNRSILVRADRKGIKDHLNRLIKFRESFRPYGASLLHDDAPIHFDLPPGFNSPYMSFAVRTRSTFKDLFSEITHIDDTSRIQTVRPGQNPVFYELLSHFKALAGHSCLLNTSLNIMGEPIIETLEDARQFLLSVPVDGLAVGDFFIQRSHDGTV